MGKENEPLSSTTPAPWKAEDVAFAAAELSREYPTTALERIASAVDFATAAIPPIAGRVKLMQGARQFLRTA